VQCLLRLLRGPTTDEGSEPDPRREKNIVRLALYARSLQLFPIFGQTALGVSTQKGWSNGETVVGAPGVMVVVVVKAIGDDVCLRRGRYDT